MDLTPKEVKFLTILNETRIADGKMLEGYSKRVKQYFSYTNDELKLAIAKLKAHGLLSELDLGADEVMYFYTDKVSKSMLDQSLNEIRH